MSFANQAGVKYYSSDEVHAVVKAKFYETSSPVDEGWLVVNSDGVGWGAIIHNTLILDVTFPDPESPSP